MQTKRKFKVVALLISFVMLLCLTNSCKSEQNPNLSSQSRIVGSNISGTDDTVSVTSGIPNLPNSSTNISTISYNLTSTIGQNSVVPIDYMKLRRDAGIHQNSIEVNNDIVLSYDNLSVIGKGGVNFGLGWNAYWSVEYFFSSWPFKCLRENNGYYYAVYISYANTVSYVVFKKDDKGEIKTHFAWVYFDSAVSFEELKINGWKSDQNTFIGHKLGYSGIEYKIHFLKDGTTFANDSFIADKISIYDIIKKDDYPEKILSTFRSEAIVNKNIDNEIKLSYENLTTLGNISFYEDGKPLNKDSENTFSNSPYKCLRKNGDAEYTIYALPKRRLLYVVFFVNVGTACSWIYESPSSKGNYNYQIIKDVLLPQDTPEKILGLE